MIVYAITMIKLERRQIKSLTANQFLKNVLKDSKPIFEKHTKLFLKNQFISSNLPCHFDTQ